MGKKLLPVLIFVFLALSFFCLSSKLFAEVKINTPSGGIIPKLPKTSNDPEFFNGHVYPNWGPVCQRYTYSVIYRDKKGRKPEYVKIYFNGKMIDMQKADLGDNDYKKGVRYEYKYVPDKLGANFYYFEASNGLGKTRDSIIDSPDNGPVLFESAFDKNEIAVVDKNTGEKILSFPTGKEWVGGVALSDNGQYLAAKTSFHVYLFDTGKPDKPLWSYEYGRGMMVGGDVKGGVDISGDGSRIVASIGSSVIFFDKKSNQPLWSNNRVGNCYNVAISQDGKYLAAATSNQEGSENSDSLIFWSAQSSQPLWRYQASGNFHDVSLSNDGSFIAGSTGCPDRRAYIFSKDSNTPLVRSEMLTRDSPVHRAKISADGQLAAFGSESDGGAVFLFSKDSQEPLWKFSAPGGSSVRSLAYTPDAEYIGGATLGGGVFILQKNSPDPVASWQLSAALGAADIADDGSFIAAGGTDNQVHLLNREEGRENKISFSEYVGGVDISANGKYIAAGTGGSVYFFESFAKDENKVFPCVQVIEPPYERQMLDIGGGDGDKPSDFCRDDRCKDNEKEPVWPGMIFGFGFLGSLLVLSGYLVIIKFNLLRRFPENKLKINKIIVILLSFLAVLFLALTIVSTHMNKMNKKQLLPLENQPLRGEKNVCGNNLCESDFGETRESCPQDCSAGD